MGSIDNIALRAFATSGSRAALRETPVVLIGGVASRLGSWNHWLSRLDDAGIAARAVSAPRMGFASIADDMQAIDSAVRGVMELTGASRVHLVGHSKGGVAARAYAAAHPELVEKVVAVGSPLQGSWAAHALSTLRRLPFLDRVIPAFVDDLAYSSSYVSKATAIDDRVTSIFSPVFDGIVTERSARLAGGTNIPASGNIVLLNHALLQTHNGGVIDAALAALKVYR